MAAIGRGFDIDDFRAVMQQKGVARNNLYKFQITPPKGAVNIPRASRDVEDIMLYCESVTMPGLQIATSDSRPYGYGPMELKGYAPVFNTMSASFIVDVKGYTLGFFRNWMRSIVNYTGEGKGYSSSTVNGAAPFEASYKSEYETTMQLYVLSGQASGSNSRNLNLEIVSKTTILRAFPTMIGDVVLSYGVTDQYLTLPVTFSYFDWYTDNIAQSSGSSITAAPPGVTNATSFPSTVSPQPVQSPGGGSFGFA